MTKLTQKEFNKYNNFVSGYQTEDEIAVNHYNFTDGEDFTFDETEVDDSYDIFHNGFEIIIKKDGVTEFFLTPIIIHQPGKFNFSGL